MDIHQRVVGGLHIAFGLIGAFFMLIGVIAMGSVAGLDAGPDLPGFLLGLGASAFVVLLIVALAQAYAGYAYLKGNPKARVFVIVFGALSLLSFPFGTALGVYTLWVLLIKRPDQRGNA